MGATGDLAGRTAAVGGLAEQVLQVEAVVGPLHPTCRAHHSFRSDPAPQKAPDNERRPARKGTGDRWIGAREPFGWTELLGGIVGALDSQLDRLLRAVVSPSHDSESPTRHASTSVTGSDPCTSGATERVFMHARFTHSLLIGTALLLAACGDDSDDPARDCTAEAPTLLQACVTAVNDAWQACYRDDGRPCTADDANVASALDILETDVRAACADGDFGSLTQDGVVERWRYSCQSEADSLAWRAFGGPQGASWESTDGPGRDCLLAVHEAGSTLIEDRLVATSDCLADQDCTGDAIDPSGARLASAVEEATSACGAVPIDRIIAIDIPTFLERSAAQVDCLAASTHVDPHLSLECGPSNAIASPQRGLWERIELDSNRFGTMCGDGSPYSFSIRLAPEGEPLDRVVIGLQGGGVCFFDDDCSARFRVAPGLFRASDDVPPVTGVMSNDPEESEFANWTKIFLPYCNQDVFIGGGITEEFSALDLHRFGAVNLRTAMRAARDILWQAMDAEGAAHGGDGYQPGELIALFGGFSAGGYGTMYNYHWVLDDLLWQRTAAYPDAGLGLDNGGLGVRSFGGLLIPVWNALEFLPPYCFRGDCAVGPDNFTAMSPRLRQVPEQQYLILSNQHDTTQQGDAFFSETPPFINAMRRGYCDTKNLKGIQWYLTSQSDSSQHTVTLFPSFWNGAVAGIAMRDWFAGAINDPDNVVDRAEEGDFQANHPGVQPFPCDVAP